MTKQTEELIGTTLWIKVVDTKKDRVFYYPKGKRIKDLEWVYRLREAKGKTFFVNLSTKKKMWKLPNYTAEELGIEPTEVKPQEKVATKPASSQDNPTQKNPTEQNKTDQVNSQPAGNQTNKEIPKKHENRDPQEQVPVKQDTKTQGGKQTSSKPVDHNAPDNRKVMQDDKPPHNDTRKSGKYDKRKSQEKRNSADEPKGAKTNEIQQIQIQDRLLLESKNVGKNKEVVMMTYKPPDVSQQTEIIENIETDLFTKIGMGEVHILLSVKAFHITNKTSGESKATKQQKMVCVVRDFVGSYGLFLCDSGGSGPLTLGKKKFTRISGSYPLIEPFECNVIETIGKNIRFDFLIQGEFLSLMTTQGLKERLETAMMYAIQSYARHSPKDLYVARMACNDFLETYNPTNIPQEAKPIEEMVEALVQSNISDEEMLSDFRLRIRSPGQRNLGFQKLIRIMETSAGLRKFPTACFALFHIFLKCTTPTDPSLEPRINKILERCSQSKKYSRLYNIHKLQVEVEALFASRREYKGRAFMKYQSFANFCIQDISYAPRHQKLRKKMRDSFVQKSLIPGAYCCFLCYTKTGKIVQDSSDNIPSFPMKRMTMQDIMNMSPESDDFFWALSLGLKPTSQLKRLMETLYNKPHASNFQKSFLETVNEMRQLFECDLGILYDRCVQIQRSYLFLFVRCIKNEEDLTLPLGMRWTDSHEFEHKQYQKYHDIDIITRMETLDGSYGGIRWIHNAMKHYQAIRNPLPKGFYIGFANFCFTINGKFNILTQNELRNMIPCEFVDESFPTLQQWNAIKRFNISDGDSYLESKYMVSGSTELYKCKTFEQRFYRAYCRLKRHLNLEDLGYVYTPSLIEMGSIKMVVFVKIADYTHFDSRMEKKKFLWRSDKLFELLHNFTYQSEAFKLWTEQKNFISSHGTLYNDSIWPTDELIRRKTEKDHLFQQEISMNKIWLCMRWPVFVLDWLKLVYRGSGILSQDQIDNLPQWRKYFEIFLKEVENKGTKWSQVESKFSILEDAEIQDKDLSNPVTPICHPLFDEEFQREEMHRWENIIPEIYETEVSCFQDVHNIEVLQKAPITEEFCRNIVHEFIEISMVNISDKLIVRETSKRLSELVDIIECTHDMMDQIVLDQTKEKALEKLHSNRTIFKKGIYEGFLHMVAGIDGEKPEILAQANRSTLLSYESNIMKTISKFNFTIDGCKELLRIINGAQEAVDLSENLIELDDLISEKESFDIKIENETGYPSESLDSLRSYQPIIKHVATLDDVRREEKHWANVLDHAQNQEKPVSPKIQLQPSSRRNRSAEDYILYKEILSPKNKKTPIATADRNYVSYKSVTNKKQTKKIAKPKPNRTQSKFKNIPLDCEFHIHQLKIRSSALSRFDLPTNLPTKESLIEATINKQKQSHRQSS